MGKTASISVQDTTKATRIDEVSGSLTYVGDAVIGTVDADAKWVIKRLQKTGTVTKVEWADGNDLADNSWANRASLSYT